MQRAVVRGTVILVLMASAAVLSAQSILTLAGGGSADGAAKSVSIVPSGMTLAPNGDLIIAEAFNNRVRRLSGGALTTIAGCGAEGNIGDGGAAAQAELKLPLAIAYDAAGNISIADSGNHRIRRVAATTGVISTIAGSWPGFSGDGGRAVDATFNAPAGIAVDMAGNVYIADSGNQRIRKIDPAGTITTIAGNGNRGFSGDGQQATTATLNTPQTLLLDGSGGLLVADTLNERIRRIDLAAGTITTVAGGGSSLVDNVPATSASLNLSRFSGVTGVVPGLAVDSAGNFYVGADLRVRKVDATTHFMTTVAGNGTFCCPIEGAIATATPLSFPSGLLFDRAGHLLVADRGAQQVFRIDRSLGTISAIAGNGSSDFVGDGASATATTFSWPTSLAFDGSGNLLVSDLFNNRLRRVTLPGGAITTIAGAGGRPDYGGDDGPAVLARFFQPDGVATDASGNIYLGDANNNRVRRIGSNGTVTTIAGNGTAGDSGDGGPGRSASINSSSVGSLRVALDGQGRLYFSDPGNHRVRRIDLANGIVTAYAGTGTPGFAGDNGPAAAASLNQPIGLAADSAGNLYIADSGNSRIRRVDAASGIITTVAGNGTFAFSGDGGAATAASLNRPYGVRAAASGEIFIADFLNGRIRRIGPDGRISTVAGSSGTPNYAGDNGPAIDAALDLPTDVAIDGHGNLFIADSRSKRVRVVYPCTTVSEPPLISPAVNGRAETAPELRWSAVPGAFSYDVYLDTTPSPSLRVATIAASTLTPYEVPGGTAYSYVTAGLVPGTPYYWKVVADGDPYCSPQAKATSAIRSFVVSPPPWVRRRAVKHPGPPEQLIVTPSRFDLAATAGADPPSSVEFIVSSAKGAVSWQTASVPSWATLSPSSGTTPTTVRLTLNTSGLGATTYNDQVVLTGGAAGTLSLSLELASPRAPYFTGSSAFFVLPSRESASWVGLDDGTAVLSPNQLFVEVSEAATAAQHLELQELLERSDARVIGQIPGFRTLQVEIAAGSMNSMLATIRSLNGVEYVTPNAFLTYSCAGTTSDAFLTADNLVTQEAGTGDPCGTSKTVLIIADCFDPSKCDASSSPRSARKYPHGQVVEEIARRSAGQGVCIRRVPLQDITQTTGEVDLNSAFSRIYNEVTSLASDPEKRFIVNISIGLPGTQSGNKVKSYQNDWELKTAAAREFTKAFGPRVALISAAGEDRVLVDRPPGRSSFCNLVNIGALDLSSRESATLAPFSIYGNTVRAFAPGCEINPNPAQYRDVDGNEEKFTGTSFAAPQWAGQLSALSVKFPEKSICDLTGAIDTLAPVGSFPPGGIIRLDGGQLVTALTSPGTGIAISITPTSKQLVAGGQWKFSATVTGTTNTAVNWSASSGTISDDGEYTAPNVPGSYSVTASAKAAPQVSATAQVTVLARATIVLDRTSLSFTVPRGQAQTKSFKISNTGGVALIWLATPGTASAWLSLSPSSGAVAPGSSKEVSVTADTRSLVSGPWTARIKVEDPTASPAEQFIDVTLTITDPVSPRISVDPTSLSFTAVAGSPAVTKSFRLTNSGNATLSFEIRDSETWMEVMPLNGSLPPDQSTMVQVTVTPGTLAAGTHPGTITIAAQDNPSITASVTVSLTITAAGPQKYDVRVKGNGTTKYQLSSTSTQYTDQITVDLIFRGVQFYEGDRTSCDRLQARGALVSAGTITGTVSGTETPPAAPPISGTVNITSGVQSLLDTARGAASIENISGPIRIDVILIGSSNPANLSTVDALFIGNPDGEFHYYVRTTGACTGFTAVSNTFTVTVTPVP